jgi:hypothetical protein
MAGMQIASVTIKLVHMISRSKTKRKQTVSQCLCLAQKAYQIITVNDGTEA